MGYSLFQTDLENTDTLMTSLGIPHVYIPGSYEAHAWDSNWVSTGVSELLSLNLPFPTPEIAVSGDSQSIADGDSTPQVADGTDFGSVLQGQVSPTSVFTITNDGTAPLSLGSVSVPAGFTLLSSLPASLVAGTSASFSVQLTASLPGTYAGNISFSNNASDLSENPFQFQITGTVVGIPQIAVSGNGLNIADGDSTPQAANGTDFGSVSVGQAGPTSVFTVVNGGTGPLTLGSISVPAGFTLASGLPTSLAPGASATFSVQLSATAAGTYAGNVSFSNNAAEGTENPFQFLITGTVIGIQGIAVSGNDQNIPDGDSTPQTADGTDFGSVPQGQAGTTSMFTVVNSGSVPLALGNVSVPNGFALLSDLSTSIVPGASVTFSVQLVAKCAGGVCGQRQFQRQSLG